VADIEIQRDVKRYTEALLQLASDKGLLNEVNKDMVSLETLFEYLNRGNSHEHFKNFRKKFPTLTHKKQLEILKNILNEMEINKLVQNFVFLLLHQKKLKLLASISSHWKDSFFLYQGYKKVIVTTAVKLLESQEKKLTDKLSISLGQKFFLDKQIDPDLIAGMTLLINGKLIDDSLSYKINTIKQSIG
jgi:F-type H+-transporting ATPase subunit delta